MTIPTPGDRVQRTEDGLWPAPDYEGQLVREVYARYGLAMFKAQVLEHGMVNALLVLRFLPMRSSYTEQGAWEADFDRFFDKEFEKTFGSLVHALSATNIVPSAILDNLHAARETRNHLAHSFFRHHDEAFMTTPGRIAMIRACEDAIVQFDAVDHEIEAFVQPYRERFGITDQWIEARFDEMVAAAERRAESPPSSAD